MKRLFVTGVIAVLAMGLFPLSGVAAAADTNAERRFLDLINLERAAAGMSPLAVRPELVDVARAWTGWMSSTGTLAHNPNLVDQAPADWERLGENVGAGSTVDGLHLAFMASPSHRANVLGDFNQAGIGVEYDASGRMWVTVNFMKSSWTATTVAPTTDAVVRAIDDSCPDGSVPEDGFLDVTADNVHESAVDCVVAARVARGTSETTYSPSAAVTREQMASFLARMIAESGGSLPDAARDHFADDHGSAHEDSINRLAEAGIVTGLSDGSFGPSRVVTRDQMTSFLVRAFQHRSGTTLTAAQDYFVDDSGNAHEPAINRAAEAGFTGGRDGYFSPGSAVTRDQMASFVARTLDKLVEDGVASLSL